MDYDYILKNIYITVKLIIDIFLYNRLLYSFLPLNLSFGIDFNCFVCLYFLILKD